jgi:DNA-binding MarR family transcriptional regulator
MNPVQLDSPLLLEVPGTWLKNMLPIRVSRVLAADCLWNHLSLKKLLDNWAGSAKVHTMNNKDRTARTNIPLHQAEQFRDLVLRLFQCCQERMQYQCERFGLPDAEIRCLLLFGEERYLTAKGIAYKLNVVKSRVTKIVDGLIRKKHLQKVADPEDSRIVLLSLTPKGQAKLKEINRFTIDFNSQVLRTIHPDQRGDLLNNLELLRISMEAANEGLE